MTSKPKTRIPNHTILLSAGLALALSAHFLLGAEQTSGPAKGRRSYPPVLPGATVETYKNIGKTNLQLYILSGPPQVEKLLNP